MSVELWFRDAMETEVVEGDLIGLTNTLNVAAANGKEFVILSDADTGEGVMIERHNIIKGRERTNAFVS